MRRIGMLTSGGDCQALNATMRGVAKSLYNMFDDVEIIGFEDGYKGLMYADYQIMKSSDFSGILTQGGTILGTSRQPFKLMRTPDENGLDKVEAMKHTYKKLKLSCLVVLGGNGSQKTANMLSEEGLNVVSLPKTIDNDLWGTDMTFGFQSAVDVATNAIDCIHTTAASHGRVFIVEVMGHKVGWLTLYAGLAGGADIILLPEIPYDINIVCDALTKRSKAGKRFSILAVAEGAISREDAKMSKKELKEKKKSGVVYPSVAYEIGATDGYTTPLFFFSFSSFLLILASSLEMAPSATARIEKRLPALDRLVRASHTILISYGISGRSIMSAPPARPAYRVSQPTLCPITSTMNTRPWDAAVV